MRLGSWTAVVVAAIIAATNALAGERRAAVRIVAFVSAGCDDCRRFSEEALLDYWHSPAAAELPLNVVDVPALGTAGNPLRRPLAVLPTFVVMRDGREAARIEGYPGRASLLAMLQEWALEPAQEP